MIVRQAIRGVLAGLAMLMVAALPGRAGAQEPASSSPAANRQSLGDAWWTGPMLAPSAGTLPRGHLLIEPYFYDVSAGHSNTFGSLAYILYGLKNRLTIGMIPTVNYDRVSDGPSSSGVQIGDVSLVAQYGLTQYHGGSRIPAIALSVQESLPTGKYDQLGDHPSDGFGSGAYTTTLSLYSQMYVWMPNGRILRPRFNVSQAFSSRASVAGVSVYGTGAGFHGRARPGTVSTADLAFEYSLTRRWVLALDVMSRYQTSTRVTGSDASAGPSAPTVSVDSRSSEQLIFAPAVEYN